MNIVSAVDRGKTGLYRALADAVSRLAATLPRQRRVEKLGHRQIDRSPLFI